MPMQTNTGDCSQVKLTVLCLMKVSVKAPPKLSDLIYKTTPKHFFFKVKKDDDQYLQRAYACLIMSGVNDGPYVYLTEFYVKI